jgi:hypothetical protein
MKTSRHAAVKSKRDGFGIFNLDGLAADVVGKSCDLLDTVACDEENCGCRARSNAHPRHCTGVEPCVVNLERRLANSKGRSTYWDFSFRLRAASLWYPPAR